MSMNGSHAFFNSKQPLRRNNHNTIDLHGARVKNARKKCQPGKPIPVAARK